MTRRTSASSCLGCPPAPRRQRPAPRRSRRRDAGGRRSDASGRCGDPRPQRTGHPARGYGNGRVGGDPGGGASAPRGCADEARRRPGCAECRRHGGRRAGAGPTADGRRRRERHSDACRRREPGAARRQQPRPLGGLDRVFDRARRPVPHRRATAGKHHVEDRGLHGGALDRRRRPRRLAVSGVRLGCPSTRRPERDRVRWEVPPSNLVRGVDVQVIAQAPPLVALRMAWFSDSASPRPPRRSAIWSRRCSSSPASC